MLNSVLIKTTFKFLCKMVWHILNVYKMYNNHILLLNSNRVYNVSNQLSIVDFFIWPTIMVVWVT